jgi:hypothetical protein
MRASRRPPRALLAALALCTAAGAAAADTATLAGAGGTVIVTAPGWIASVRQDGTTLLEGGPALAPTVQGAAARALPGEVRRLDDRDGEVAFALAFDAAATGLAADLSVERRFRLLTGAGGGPTVEETLRIVPGRPLGEALSYRVPLVRIATGDGPVAFLPRRDGWGQEVPVAAFDCASYDLAGHGVAPRCTPLALPLLDLDLGQGWRLAVFTDPLFSSTFVAHRGQGEVGLALSWRWPGERVPLARQERRVYLHLHRGGPAEALDAFLRLTAVSRVPAWLDSIRLVYFDYLSDGGRGWYRDLDALARRIPEAERGAVAVTLHGWYDRLGAYAYDERADRLLDHWPALPGRYGRRQVMSVAEVRHRLAYARGLGFRALLYFADGVCIDTATRRGAATPAELGICPWSGPEVEGRLLRQSPADPEVRSWFRCYLEALLAAFGDTIDGLVWDETFWIRRGAVSTSPGPALAAPAMLTLTRELTERVEAFDRDLAFLVSDNIGLAEGIDAPPNALMAHGTFQDSECDRRGWSWGLLPSWRKPLWSVLWSARSRFDDLRDGVLRAGAPVSLSNGWADDEGPAEMPAERLDEALRLFRWLGRNRPRPGWLEEEPERWLARPLGASP